MKFINGLNLCAKSAVAIALIALTGCSGQLPTSLPGIGQQPNGTGEQTNSPETAVAETATNSDSETTDLTTDPSGVALPPANPYLANAVAVDPTTEALFNQALAVQLDKDWTAAELAWQELILVAPNLSGPYLNLGLVYDATNRLAEAQTAYEKAIEVNSLNLDAYNQLAILKRKQGDFKGAEANYLSALSIWPEHAKSHLNLGILYELYMGDLSNALLHYEQYQALQTTPDDKVDGWIRDLRRRVDQQDSGS